MRTSQRCRNAWRERQRQPIAPRAARLLVLTDRGAQGAEQVAEVAGRCSCRSIAAMAAQVCPRSSWRSSISGASPNSQPRLNHCGLGRQADGRRCSGGARAARGLSEQRHCAGDGRGDVGHRRHVPDDRGPAIQGHGRLPAPRHPALPGVRGVGRPQAGVAGRAVCREPPLRVQGLSGGARRLLPRGPAVLVRRQHLGPQRALRVCDDLQYDGHGLALHGACSALPCALPTSH